MPGGFCCQPYVPKAQVGALGLTNTAFFFFLPFNALNIQNPILKGEPLCQLVSRKNGTY